jgi:hypothetical protein
LLKLDLGFCKPNSLKFKEEKDMNGGGGGGGVSKSVKSGGENDASDVEMSENNDQSEEKKEKDDDITRVKVAQFKFWPNTEIRSAWRSYIFTECTETSNINALYVGLKLLQKATEEFMQRQMDNLHKRQKKQDKVATGNQLKSSSVAEKAVVRKEKPNYK